MQDFDINKVIKKLETFICKLEPKISKVQKCTIVGEPPPYKLMAGIMKNYVDILETIDNLSSELFGDDNDDIDISHGKNLIKLMHKLHTAYNNNDRTEIAIGNAELLGLNFNYIKEMVKSLKQVLNNLGNEFNEFDGFDDLDGC